MDSSDTFVQKSVVYVTRVDGAVLAFEGPGHDGLQVPKGTVETGETAREAAFREVAEETGLGALGGVRELATDCWHRRETPTGDRWYVRHFFHATVHGPRERWTHVVTGAGEEAGDRYRCRWLPPSVARRQQFALDLDDYLGLLPGHRDPVPGTAEGTRAPNAAAGSD
jgi:8-oxo-dGTP pyrophosphatase MutT (NUDIX family)